MLVARSVNLLPEARAGGRLAIAACALATTAAALLTAACPWTDDIYLGKYAIVGPCLGAGNPLTSQRQSQIRVCKFSHNIGMLQMQHNYCGDYIGSYGPFDLYVAPYNRFR